MVEYKVKLSVKAKNDYKSIISYLKDELLEPSIANNYAKLINSGIQTLAYFPHRYAIIDDDAVKDLEYRKLIIKNYIAFYRIDESKKVVEIYRILHGASDWMYKL